MQLSLNQKMFSEFFSSFPQSTYNLKYFEKKDDPQRLFLFQIIDSKMRVTIMPKKLRVRTLMDSQDIKRSETLHESARQYFCHVF